MTEALHSYEAYGDRLASGVVFPELRETSPGPARWTFDVVPVLEPMRDARELGADLLYADVHARLFAHATGHRIIVDDTGEFDVARDLRAFRCAARPDAWPDFVRAHLLGRVLSTAMFLEGRLPLHGSAVATREGVLAFLAPKGFGKSSLALALSAAGARLVTDDTLPVEDGALPVAWPGVHSLRVRDEVLDAVGVARPALDTREGKLVVTEIEGDRLQREPAPLRAIYLLDPDTSREAVTSRSELPSTLGAISIVAHVKIGRMLGPDAAATMLERAAAIVRGVPVHRLRLPRDLARLPAVAREIIDWHGGAA